jgi:PadR family transcriptional regulator, regulatory protein PadR
MARSGLGEFEHIVLLAIVRLARSAYGLAIRELIVARTGRRVAAGAVYTTLDRLERKGLVRSAVEQGTVALDNRFRRRYVMTRRGLAAVGGAQTALRRMAHGLAAAWARG